MVLVRLRFSSIKFIFCNVSRYMILMLLPLSTIHLVNSTPSIKGLMTMAYWCSIGVRSGWSVLSQVIGTSDQCRYWGTGGESSHQDPQGGLLLSDGGRAKESVVDWSLLC